MSKGGHKRLLILGCGYLGERLATACLADGWSVGALTRNAEQAARLRTRGLEPVVEVRLDSPDWWERVEPEPDLVVNCVSGAGGGLDGYRQSYVEGNRSLAAWARQARPGTLVYTGSTGVYPAQAGAEVNEDSPTGGEPGSRPALLREAEEIALGAEGFARSFVLRLAGLYGPGRHGLLDRLRAGESVLPGRPEQPLNLTHVDDAVAAIRTLAAQATLSGGIFNVCDDAPRPKAEVVRWLCERLGRPVPTFDEQARGRRGVPDRRISNARLKTVTDWKPLYPSFREGYAAMLDEEGLRA